MVVAWRYELFRTQAFYQVFDIKRNLPVGNEIGHDLPGAHTHVYAHASEAGRDISVFPFFKSAQNRFLIERGRPVGQKVASVFDQLGLLQKIRKQLQGRLDIGVPDFFRQFRVEVSPLF